MLAPKTRYLTKGGPVGGKLGVGGFPPDHGVIRLDLLANLTNDLTCPGEYSIFVEVRMGIVEIDGQVTTRVGRSNELKVKVEDFPLVVGANTVEIDYGSLQDSPGKKSKE